MATPTRTRSHCNTALSPKQLRFVHEYLRDQNATQAAVRAGYSPATANKQGPRLLVNVGIAAAIRQAQAASANAADVTIHSLAEELERVRLMALQQKNCSAAVAATMGKAKLFGLGRENLRHSGGLATVTVTSADLQALSEAELGTLEGVMPILEKLGLIDRSEENAER